MILRGERLPADELRAKIAEVYGIDPRAWVEADAPAAPEPQRLVKLQPRAAKRAAVPAPAPEPARAPAAPPAEPDGEGPLLERAREVRRQLEVEGLSQTEIARLKAVQAALTFEANLTGQGKVKAGLDKHPDFAPWLDGLVAALEGVPGALEALEAWLTSATEQSRKEGA